MAVLAPRMVCSGCAAEVPADEPFPFRCPDAERSPDVDHVLRTVAPRDPPCFPRGGEPNPFVRWRELSFPWRFARANGMSDESYRALVGDLDRAIGDVDGRGFSDTPFGRADALSDRLGFGIGGGVWVKDETGDVSGSHKARHLAGVMIQLQVAEVLGLADERADARLAIASCGNAALAASVVAHAAGRELEVYIPPHAEPSIVAALERHGARTTVCPRVAGELGDPCYLRFREALAAGALPFCCQGNQNGLAIDGAKIRKQLGNPPPRIEHASRGMERSCSWIRP